MKLRIVFLLALMAPALGSAAVTAQEPYEGKEYRRDGGGVVIPEITDLREEADLSRRYRLPILILFSSEDCPYCVLMKEDFLRPMIISGDYFDKVIIRRVERGLRSATLRDFDGRTISVASLFSRYGVRVVPTLVFVDDKGNPLTENLVGIATPELYGASLDMAVDEALERLRRANP